MQAIVFTRYGSPDVLQLVEREKPTPTGSQVLIKVYAAATNPLDWHSMRGAPYLVRLGGGLRKPKDTRIGADVAGVVEAVGPDVTQFSPGDEVYGTIGAGAFAEYACASEKNFGLKPANLSFEQAAAVPIAGYTALQGLRDAGELKAGEKVLINGASGGVGTFAVQIAKAFGAKEVTGVCSTRNLEMVRSIGADHVIDYTKEDFTRTGPYDLIYCAVGNRSTMAYRRALAPNGRCMIAGFTTMPRMIGQMLTGTIVSMIGNKTVGGTGIAQPNQKDLGILSEMLAAGTITPVIDRCYPLSETAEAMRYLETMHARGKVVIQVAANGA
jgi:NADPH:quinone reductase-like Zn-dependent oxidoreductase